MLNTSTRVSSDVYVEHRAIRFARPFLIFLIWGLFADGGAYTSAAGPGMIAGGGETVTGVVGVAGSYPWPKPSPVFKNRAFCGTSLANETLLIGAGGGLRNAVVLFHALSGKAASAPGTVILDNKRCAFAPHVQVATVGSELLLKNSDPILHTVHARIGGETLFNVGLPQWRQVIKRLDRVGVMRIDCDVLHTWMSAAIVVTDTPYFAVTDETGRFSIGGLVPGRYEIEVWHERLGAQSMGFAVGGGTSRFIELVYGAK